MRAAGLCERAPRWWWPGRWRDVCVFGSRSDAKVGGLVVLPKGSGLETELEAAGRALGILGSHMVASERMRPEVSEMIAVALFRKDRGTPALYPRQAGTPGKSPL